MIDHVSIAVRDLEAAARFYQAVLGAIGFAKLETRPRTIGFGKKYPEFWLNLRPDMRAPAGGVGAQDVGAREFGAQDVGAHVCLRAPGPAAVDAFHAAALASGGTSDGAPAFRPQHGEGYYAAFIRDADGNRVEAVTFVTAGA